MRHRAHERAAAGLRPERVEPGDQNDGLERLIHEEIERLPDRYRCVVVLCDLESRTHEQAARHLGCAVGTVKSRLSRGREKLRGRLMCGESGPKPVVMAAHTAPARRAAVPATLADSTVSYAAGPVASAGAIPATVVTLTRGVLISMFLSKSKIAAVTIVVAATLTAGAFVFAQHVGQPPERRPGTGTKMPPRFHYEIRLSRDGGEPLKVAELEVTDGKPAWADTPDASIIIRPKNDLADGTNTFIDAMLRSMVGQAETKAAPKDQARGPGTITFEDEWTKLGRQFDKADQRTQREITVALKQALAAIVEHSKQERAIQLDIRDQEALLQAMQFLLAQAERSSRRNDEPIPKRTEPKAEGVVPTKEAPKTDTDRLASNSSKRKSTSCSKR